MAVALEGIAVDYGKLRVLQPTDLAVTEGEFLTILGPSGSGKTTILRAIGGFVTPSAGRIMLNGRDIVAMPPERRPFNTVFQDYALFPHMNVAENVAFSLLLKGQDKPSRRKQAEAALDLVGLAGYGERKINQLSGGQRQRVALARAIVAKPSVILLDEPLSALDAALRLQMQVFLKDIQRQVGMTFILVTHDQHEALAISDRVVVMNHGSVQQIGSGEDIYNAPANEFVAQFIGRNNLIEITSHSSTGHAETQVGTIAVNERDEQARAPDVRHKLSVRPEHIRLLSKSDGESADTATGTNRIAGTVREAVFGGARWVYQVSVGPMPGLQLEVEIPISGAGHFVRGDAVFATFEAKDARLVRAG